MDENIDAQPVINDHVEETIRSIALLRSEHERTTRPLQRFIDNLTAAFGRPTLVVWLTVVVALWVSGNTATLLLGYTPIDAPPFSWLECTASLVSLYLVIFILASQRREDALARRRELLALELAVLSEQKTAKVIELLEEFRRDSPHLPDRVDNVANRMAQPADPSSVVNAITETDGEAAQPQ